MKPDDNSNFYKYYDCNKCREEFSEKKNLYVLISWNDRMYLHKQLNIIHFKLVFKLIEKLENLNILQIWLIFLLENI